MELKPGIVFTEDISSIETIAPFNEKPIKWKLINALKGNADLCAVKIPKASQKEISKMFHEFLKGVEDEFGKIILAVDGASSCLSLLPTLTCHHIVHHVVTCAPIELTNQGMIWMNRYTSLWTPGLPLTRSEILYHYNHYAVSSWIRGFIPLTFDEYLKGGKVN